MRFSTIVALCAAPLALAASSLKAELVERTNGASVTITEVIVIWINLGGTATTKTINTETSVGTAAAVTHTVIVGGTAGLIYQPDTISAAVGDMVVFEFMSANHTVTESAFAKPCVKLADGMDSGFMANPNNTVVPAPAMAMQVTVSTPLWFYCRQANHCGKGMVFSINPTQNKSQADFKALAISQNGTAAVATSTLATAVIVGGPASTVAPAAATSSASSGSMVSGSGTVVTGGACECSCFCGVASFPSVAQGLAAFGGLPGAMPMAALEK